MIHILLRYLGIKTKLIDIISDKILENTNENDIVLDLFGGSNIVAATVHPRRTVYTNDIQQYSMVCSNAILGKVDKKTLINISLDKVITSKHFNENYEYLYTILERPLKEEKNIIDKCVKLVDSDSFEINDDILLFKEFYDNEPYIDNFKKELECFSGLEYFYSRENYELMSMKRDKYTLFSMVFAMPYFSLNQAVFIDSYRYTIDKLKKDGELNSKEYSIYLASLMYLLQNIVTSVGDHFAQPQKFKLIEEAKYYKELIKIIKKKSLDLENCLRDKLDEFKNSKEIKSDNKAYNFEFQDILDNKKIMKNVSAVYMDPPYTNAHYSRFYHILETLVKYDYPEVQFQGRYSTERFQSPFCIKSKATYAFDMMIKKCSLSNKSVFISYADTKQCIIRKDDIIQICKKYYTNIEVEEIDYLYRNFGQKPNKVKGNEMLIICKNRKDVDI